MPGLRKLLSAIFDPEPSPEIIEQLKRLHKTSEEWKTSTMEEQSALERNILDQHRHRHG